MIDGNKLNLEQLRKAVEAGPPPAPTPENPGPLMATLQLFVEETAKRKGFEKTEDLKASADLACNLIFVLAGALDLHDWNQRMEQYDRIKVALDKLTGPLIQVPGR